MPVVVLIDKLSQTIPANTYLTELTWRTERCISLASRTMPPALLEVLDSSDTLTDVRFAAPTTRDEGASRIASRSPGGTSRRLPTLPRHPPRLQPCWRRSFAARASDRPRFAGRNTSPRSPCRRWCSLEAFSRTVQGGQGLGLIAVLPAIAGGDSEAPDHPEHGATTMQRHREKGAANPSRA